MAFVGVLGLEKLTLINGYIVNYCVDLWAAHFLNVGLAMVWCL